MAIFPNKANGLMGVDISSTGIKLVELAQSHSGYELKAMAMAPLPRDAIVENAIVDPTAVSKTLLDVVAMARPSTRNVAFVVSGNAVIIRTIIVPTMTEFELENQIEFEADQYIPDDVDDVYLDFQILGELPDDETQMEVVLAACKRGVVEDNQLVLNEAGLTPQYADCAVFALENAAELFMDQVEESADESSEDSGDVRTHALVNIGANLININILQNGQMTFVRDQFYGGNNLTEEIQKAHGISYQAAEQMKLENFQGIKADALEGFYVGLASELVRSLDFYGASNDECPVQKLFLSGGTALLPGIAGEMAQRLEIETQVLNPFSVISSSSRKFDPEYLNRIGPMMMVPVGLALRGFDA